MENRKRERIIEAGMALLLVITLLAAGQSGKIPVVKSQEIQVQADSGKENESKEKGNTENTDSETTGTEKNSGDTGKNESGSDMESVAVAASADGSRRPSGSQNGKAMYPYRKWSIILTDQDELIRLQHWQQEGRILSRHFARFIMKRQLQKESDRKLPMYRQ